MARFDSQGNKMGMGDDGVYLQLAKSKKVLQIFKIKHGKLSKWVSERNIFKKVNAIGFNYHALMMLKEKGYNSMSIIVENHGTHHVKISDLLKEANFLWFKREGFEKQVFWTLPS